MSALPASKFFKNKSRPAPISYLYAANKTVIPLYDIKVIQLNIGLRRAFTWSFFIADVDRPILGIDFLAHYRLLMDPFNRLLIDSETKLKVKCGIDYSPSSEITAISPATDIEFSEILRKYPNINSPKELLFLPPVSTGVRHHIITKGPPVSCRPRRLSPAQLKVAKAQFQLFMQLGICRPSSSPWASPLHLVLKEDETWRVTGDYCALNAISEHDSYPIPHIQDFALNLSDCISYSRIDLVKAFHQIPMAQEDIPKTAVITPFGLFEFVRRWDFATVHKHVNAS